MQTSVEKKSTGKAGKRRRSKRARELRLTMKINPALFERRWHKVISGWISEIHFRAKDWNREIRAIGEAETGCKAETSKMIGRAGVFDFLTEVKDFINSCGKEIEQKVGEETRRILTAECVKALSNVFDANFSKSLTQAWLYHRIKY